MGSLQRGISVGLDVRERDSAALLLSLKPIKVNISVQQYTFAKCNINFSEKHWVTIYREVAYLDLRPIILRFC